MNARRNYAFVGCVIKCRIISHSQQKTKCHCGTSTFPLSWWQLCHSQYYVRVLKYDRNFYVSLITFPSWKLIRSNKTVSVLFLLTPCTPVCHISSYHHVQLPPFSVALLFSYKYDSKYNNKELVIVFVVIIVDVWK